MRKERFTKEMQIDYEKYARIISYYTADLIA